MNITQEDISTLVQDISLDRVKGIARVNNPDVENMFSDDIYCRKMFIPANHVVVGKKHKTRHFNVLLLGFGFLIDLTGISRVKAGCVWESLPGIQKIFCSVTDCVYMTIHSNIANSHNLQEIERMVVFNDKQMDLFPELNKIPFGNDRRYLK